MTRLWVDPLHYYSIGNPLEMALHYVHRVKPCLSAEYYLRRNYFFTKNPKTLVRNEPPEYEPHMLLVLKILLGFIFYF